MKWFQQAANEGFAPAQIKLGFIYDKGINVVENNRKAFDWYLLAARQGNAEAQFMTGMMYMKGEGAPQDMHEASKWLLMAGDKGQQSAEETVKQFNQQLALVATN